MGLDLSVLTAYINGEYVRASEAKISVFDHGLLYGDGVFDVLRIVDGALFRPHDHFSRLRIGASLLEIDVPFADDECITILSELTHRSNLQNGTARIIVTCGQGPLLMGLRPPKPTLIIMVTPSVREVQQDSNTPLPLGTSSGSALRPCRLVISSIVDKSPRSIPAPVKSLNYLDSIIARRQAWALGVDEAILLDSNGAVAECAGANIFLFVSETLVTPPVRAALPGVTRQCLLEIANDLGVRTEIRDVYPAELYAADAVFITGSGTGPVPVEAIDGRRIAGVDNQIVARLMDGYSAMLRDPRYTVPLRGARR